MIKSALFFFQIYSLFTSCLKGMEIKEYIVIGQTHVACTQLTSDLVFTADWEWKAISI